jgi:hypothetical protein
MMLSSSISSDEFERFTEIRLFAVAKNNAMWKNIKPTEIQV